MRIPLYLNLSLSDVSDSYLYSDFFPYLYNSANISGKIQNITRVKVIFIFIRITNDTSILTAATKIPQAHDGQTP